MDLLESVMKHLPLAPSCPTQRSCAWNAHNVKHLPRRGLTRDDTRHGPAVYSFGIGKDAVCEIETATVREPTRVLSPPPGKSEYVRDTGTVIGLDAGQDATYSFV